MTMRPPRPLGEERRGQRGKEVSHATIRQAAPAGCAAAPVARVAVRRRPPGDLY
jgi:hypothetical protein